MRIVRYIVLIVMLVFAVSAQAQSLGLSNEQVTLSAIPSVPNPRDTVELKLESYATDLSRAQINWYIDGELQNQAIGDKTFSLTAPPVGGKITVQVIIRTIDAGTVTKQLVVQPAQVDLAYESLDSYVPLGYQGKALPAHESPIRVVALPFFLNEEGQKLDPDTLVYRWEVSNQAMTEQSGFGKQTLVIPGSSVYRTKTIRVEVEDVEGELVASRAIAIPAYDPVIRFYENNPLWGTDIDYALVGDSDFILDAPEIEIEAAPYFFSDLDDREQVEYRWTINNALLRTYGDPNVINLRAEDGTAGRSIVGLEINHTNRLFQAAHSVFTVVFGQNNEEEEAAEQASSLFGL